MARRLADGRWSNTRRWPSRPPSPDRHVPQALRPPAERLPGSYYNEPDEIELACPACTAEWRDDGWQHERSCVFARTAAR